MLCGDGTESDVQLVDLAPCEQVSRGQELLQLLFEPAAPCAIAGSRQTSQPLPSVSERSPSAPLTDSASPVAKTRVKNTFIEFAPPSTPHRRNLKRCQSDSEIVLGSVELLPAVDLCCRRINILLQPSTLNLDTGLDDGLCLDGADTFLELSEASTDTPRESLEDGSSHEGFDGQWLGDSRPEESTEMCQDGTTDTSQGDYMLEQTQFGGANAFTGMTAAYPEDLFYYVPAGQICQSSQQTSANLFHDYSGLPEDAPDQQTEHLMMYDLFQQQAALYPAMVVGGKTYTRTQAPDDGVGGSVWPMASECMEWADVAMPVESTFW